MIEHARSFRGAWLTRAMSVVVVTVMAVTMALSVPYAAKAGTGAVQGEELDALLQALLFRDVTEVLSDEGRAMADDFVEAGYGVPKPAWQNMLDRLYDPKAMAHAFRSEMGKALEDADLAPMVAFFTTDLGQRIARLELDTRKAMTGEAAQAAAGEAWAALDPDTRRAELIEDYVQANDLVEMNVVGAMNSDIAYYRGLWTVAGSDAMSESDLMREIWSTEPEVRADVSEWVYGFSTLAYETLSDEEFARYVAFSRSEVGRQLNFALFAAFDAVYADLSRGLGAGTSMLMQMYDGEQL